MYVTSVQTQYLFRYVQEQLHGSRPLIMAGLERQHTGAKAKELLFVDLERFLRQRYPAAIDGDWGAFRSISLSTFASRNYRPTDDERTRFFDKLSRLKQMVATDSLVNDSLTSS